MRVTIDAALAERLPNLALGVLQYSGVTVAQSPKLLQGRINLFVESLRAEHDVSKITEIPGVKAWRTAFKRAGTDPSRYRPSSEALLRRLLQGNPFFWINSAVDLNNFVSVRNALPCGIYDAAKLTGSVVCRLGGPDDRYEGLNGREVHMEGKILLTDASGAFGSPIVDSVRTCVTDEARELLHVIFFHEECSPNEREEIVGSTARMFTELHGGEVAFSQVVTA